MRVEHSKWAIVYLRQRAVCCALSDSLAVARELWRMQEVLARISALPFSGGRIIPMIPRIPLTPLPDGTGPEFHIPTGQARASRQKPRVAGYPGHAPRSSRSFGSNIRHCALAFERHGGNYARAKNTHARK